MVRILSEEPDPWEKEPELPKRTVRLPELSEDAKLMRKGEGPIRDYWEGKEIALRGKYMRMGRMAIMEQRIVECHLKYGNARQRRCDRLHRDFAQLVMNPQCRDRRLPPLTPQMYADLFEDNGRLPDIYNDYGARDTGPLSQKQNEEGEEEGDE
uniref:Uncharacterized protein n=1 Tax=Rhodosorus marinus TaxID=101924 RepID=A0A7S0BGU3_9RHOD|mmetsp:Transcript_15619/g.22871  ORF Transcript_15619/g.22871 Transcript_15619/m.22871 type:complete len:154 (+) Transcript_15619:141-602(+)